MMSQISTRRDTFFSSLRGQRLLSTLTSWSILVVGSLEAAPPVISGLVLARLRPVAVSPCHGPGGETIAQFPCRGLPVASQVRRSENPVAIFPGCVSFCSWHIPFPPAPPGQPEPTRRRQRHWLIAYLFPINPASVGL
ncbi:hypothetical protein N657DRAFT_421567 [Parathielavia appendiculata]|uniref:Uncharacterized protein n=1 Tax=Parathielavia appendiculata TaxID=2587402 RepID=A0AAN6U0S9_9PEZI|nr:hypothetical protein N657DRAFT_421567 [Parathielavia appendiculata]